MAEIVIEVSEDQMSAYATIIAGGEEAISVDEVEERLRKEGVTFGIDKEAIIFAINEKHLNKQFLAASGKAPVPGKDATFKPMFEKKGKTSFAAGEEGEEGEKIDYKKLGLIQNVRAKTVVMLKVPSTKGTPGKKLQGELIPTTDGEDKPIPLGRNTSLSSDRLQLIADIDGFLVFEEDRIHVDTVYETSTDVGVETGNLEVYGDIIVNGDVRPGYRVKATGNIEVRGTVGKAFLEAGGDILIQNGIKGKDGGKVKAKGEIRTKFIENGNVESEQDIFVSEGILHSNVDANGRIIVVEGKKGIIVGGRVRARDEINAKVIGSWNETPTRVEVGISPQAREEAAELEEEIEEGKKDFKELRLQIKTLLALKEKSREGLPPDKEKILIQRLKSQNTLMVELKKATIRLAQFQKELLATTGGKICIFDTIYPQSKLCVQTSSLEIAKDAKYITYFSRAGEMATRVYEEPRLEKKAE